MTFGNDVIMELYSCIGTGGGLLSDSAKPLPEPIIIKKKYQLDF